VMFYQQLHCVQDSWDKAPLPSPGLPCVLMVALQALPPLDWNLQHCKESGPLSVAERSWPLLMVAHCCC